MSSAATSKNITKGNGACKRYSRWGLLGLVLLGAFWPNQLAAIAGASCQEAGAKYGEVWAQQAEVSRLKAERQGNLEAQRATIARIEAEVNNARAEFARCDSLYRQGALSATERDSRRLAIATTEQRLAEAETTLSRIQMTSTQQISQAQAALDRIEDIRPVDVNAARAEVDAAIASVAEAQANLDQAYVKSPSAGQIVEVHTRPGETVSSDGIVNPGATAADDSSR